MSIEDLPKLIIGGAVFNTQYNENPKQLKCAKILDEAFSRGFNALDTSPYYGPSEEIIGDALKKIQDNWARDQYFICTKAGRVKLDEFDYSRDSVRKSVERSLLRLSTTYLDLVYMHDIEFVTEQEIFEALKELKLLQKEGKIRYIGVSGYPIDFLYKIALACTTIDEIGPLDMIMSYCHGCLQNGTLFEYYDRLINECKLKKIMNGSILSMSMLRSGETKSFHPGAQELKDTVHKIAQDLKNEDGIELADLSTRYAMRKWLYETDLKNDASGKLLWNKKCSIVLGVSTVQELEDAIEGLRQVENDHDANKKDDKLFEKVIKALGSQYNATWESGIKH